MFKGSVTRLFSRMGVNAYKGILWTFIFFLLITASVFFFRSLFNLTSSNSALYLIKDDYGRLHITRDLSLEDSGKLVFMIDANPVFKFLDSMATALTDDPFIEVTWDEENGKGIIKEFRPDGTIFQVVLSRYTEGGIPHGIFIGGELPFGDANRFESKTNDNTGMSYYDGKKWQHIWCSINEAFEIKGIKRLFSPWDWRYIGSKVIKKSSGNEVMIESLHQLNTHLDNAPVPVKLSMRRTLSKRSGEDYIRLRVEVINRGSVPVNYAFMFGDEPWVGRYGSSAGNVGWSRETVYRHESFISPFEHNFAGFWDIGNDLAGEKDKFSGYANFVEWTPNPPTTIYFSNDFGKVEDGRVLNSPNNRVIDLMWLNQELMPDESKSYTLAIGMAKPSKETLPVKPEVMF